MRKMETWQDENGDVWTFSQMDDGVMIHSWCAKKLLRCHHLQIPTHIGIQPVRVIGEKAFRYCSKLTKVEIAEGVTEIEEEAFENCEELETVILPASLTKIGKKSFERCYKLSKLRIPSRVTHIGADAFAECTSLQIEVNPQNQNYSSLDGALLDKPMKKLIRGPGGVSSYRTPSGVTEISKFAFKGALNLVSIAISEGVTKIGHEAFCGSRYLKNVTLPSTLRSIGINAFLCCSELESITIPKRVKEIGSIAFRGCNFGIVKFKGPPPCGIGKEDKNFVFFGYTDTAYYSKEFAAEWKAVLDNQGYWSGMKMIAYKDDE